MSQKTQSPVHAFRQARTIDALPENLRGTDYLVPMIAKDMGQLIGLEADALHVGWEPLTAKLELLDAYRQLCSETALLLSLCGVETISDEAVYSVSHRLASNVHPLVALDARVSHLYRAYVQNEPENIRQDAEKLWASLEYRSEAVTGFSFAELLKADQ